MVKTGKIDFVAIFVVYEPMLLQHNWLLQHSSENTNYFESIYLKWCEVKSEHMLRIWKVQDSLSVKWYIFLEKKVISVAYP